MSELRRDVDMAELDRRSQGRFPAMVGLEMVRLEERCVVMRLALRGADRGQPHQGRVRLGERRASRVRWRRACRPKRCVI